jgi:arabinosyltransferase B
VGWLLLIAACTIPISPNSVLVAAPILVFAPRLVAIVRSAAFTRMHLAAVIALLACTAAVGLTVTFADQSWDALVVATDWHTFFGPSLPWYDESVRYHYLLQADQQGSFAKRLPVLLSVAMLPVIAVFVRRCPDPIGRAAARLAVVVALALALFALSPSKWSYHFGAAAGLFAALLTVTIVMLCGRARAPDRSVVATAAAGSILAAGAAALAFTGPNAWWLSAVYDVPWPTGPPRPFGVPLAQPLLWIGLVALPTAAATITARRRAAMKVAAAGPAVVTFIAMGGALDAAGWVVPRGPSPPTSGFQGVNEHPLDRRQQGMRSR